MARAFPKNQKAAARTAFGLFNPEQGRRIFSRDQSSGYEPIVLEVAPRTWYIQPGMVNIGLFETDEGLVLVDTGCAGDGPGIVEAVRSVSDKPLHTVVFTHGHSDHAFGLWAFLEAGENPRVIAHENVVAHFERYMKTAGLQALINGQLPGPDGKRWATEREDFVWPTEVFRDTLELRIGGERFVLRHAKGETDDATWVWAPERGVLAAGDLVTGYLPNAGNPRKVQRYAEEWADAAEEMVRREPSVIIPGHGELVTGQAAIQDELRTLAKYLRHIVEHALRGLNSGVTADEIVESLQIPEELASHPRLRPVYDKPQFICRNVIRRYAGWWDGYPANLLPAPRVEQCAEIANLAGGVDALIDRAWTLAERSPRLASHLAEWAFIADRGDARAQDAYQRILERRASEEPSLMAQVNLRISGRWVHEARSEAGAEGWA